MDEWTDRQLNKKVCSADTLKLSFSQENIILTTFRNKRLVQI